MAELNIGDPAPDFETVDDQERPIRLSSFRGKKVILYFYPKDDTSGCTTQACSFRDTLPAIEAANAVVLGVSPDDAASHRKFRSKYQLNFPLLVDQDHKIAEAYGAWGEKSMYGRKYMGVIRSHFVIDPEGRIADAVYNVKARKSAELAVSKL